MDSVWFKSDKQANVHRKWFIHMGLGFNIRSVVTQIKMTKKIAHYFVEAPDDFTVNEAIRWGQVHALGGDRRLTESLLGSIIGCSFKNHDFWTSVIRYFIENPFIERKNVGPIIDYINHQKFIHQEIMIGPGIVEEREPPQPNFSMRRRNPNTLLNLVSQWHDGLKKSNHAKHMYFKKSGISEYMVKKQKGDNKKTWRIYELLSGEELIKEGTVMHHCIATYASSCMSGKCSIWSMIYNDDLGKKKLLTIEVNKQGMINECRGKHNRWPTTKEFSIMKDWANKEKLRINKYIQINS